MDTTRKWLAVCCGLLACTMLLAVPATLSAQAVDVGGDGGDGGGAGNPNTIGAAGQSGVFIDAEGVLKYKYVRDPSGQLTRRKMAEAHAALNKDVAKRSELRKVSLNRLEAALAERAKENRPPTGEMLYLAGLQRIEYVFLYPESGDVVIAGPADGWGENLADRVVGVHNGRPVLKLEDLVVALRAFPPSGRSVGAVTCSIDPTAEGLKRMQKFMRTLRPQPTQRWAQYVARGLSDSLGLQVITIGGISPKTHFAKVLVEADYRMKLIGIGIERPPVKLVSYVERANPATVARNAMQRWYFVPDYECVRASEDGLAAQLVGEGVKLVGEDEVVRADGSRVASGARSRASEQFVKAFTEVYPQLAAKVPVYAELRNCIDMLVAAAFMQKHDFYGKSGWRCEFFGSEEQFAVETHNPPKKVSTAVNIVWKRNRLMTPLGGGVQIIPSKALEYGKVLEDEGGKVAGQRAALDLSTLPRRQRRWD